VIEKSSSIEMEVSKEEFLSKWNTLLVDERTLDAELRTLIDEKPALIDFSKWGIYLPIEYKIRLLKERYFDFTSTTHFIRYIDLVWSSS
jgi:ATP-dependent Lhr-like helicase